MLKNPLADADEDEDDFPVLKAKAAPAQEPVVADEAPASAPAVAKPAVVGILSLEKSQLIFVSGPSRIGQRR